MASDVLIRVEGSPRYGMGHVMRCIALAQALRARRTGVTFVMRELPGEASSMVVGHGFEVVFVDGDSEWAIAVAAARGARAIVLDLAHVDTLADHVNFVNYARELSKAGLAVIVIEGMDSECISLREPVPARAVVVPYFAAETRRYIMLPGVSLYAGAQYFPFRPEFAQPARKAEEVLPAARRILVSLGGGDVKASNDKVAAALSLLRCGDIEVQFTGQASRASTMGIVGDMAARIRWCDLAIIGSGLTRYETALLGTPALTYALQPTHAPMVEEFATTGAIVYGGVIAEIPPEAIAAQLFRLMADRAARLRMAQRGPAITDGRGAERIADLVLQKVSWP